jgi:hypothetical protein
MPEDKQCNLGTCLMVCHPDLGELLEEPMVCISVPADLEWVLEVRRQRRVRNSMHKLNASSTGHPPSFCKEL